MKKVAISLLLSTIVTSNCAAMDIDAQDVNGYTPLFLVAARCKLRPNDAPRTLQTAQAVLRIGANPLIPAHSVASDIEGSEKFVDKTPAEVARMQDDDATCALLAEYLEAYESMYKAALKVRQIEDSLEK